MNYAITEDEYNVIQSVRGQLNLICGLLTAKGSNSALFESSDLYDFLAAQYDTINNVLKTADERHDAAKDENNRMSWFDWADILEVISGHQPMRGVDLKKLGRKLQNCAKVDPDMSRVFRTWQAVMTSDGERPFSLEPSSTDGFYIQFPVREAVIEEPAPAKKPAQRKRDKLAAKTVEVVS